MNATAKVAAASSGDPVCERTSSARATRAIWSPASLATCAMSMPRYSPTASTSRSPTRGRAREPRLSGELLTAGETPSTAELRALMVA